MTKTVSFTNFRNLTLVGSLWPAPSDAIILMAHGSGSNRLAGGVFEKIGIELNKEGYNVLSFDRAGHGQSEDDIITLQKTIDDVASALLFVKQEGYRRIALFGHSLGAFACLSVYRPDIETMILLGALTGPVHWKWQDICSPEQLKEMYQKGYITAFVNDGLRQAVRIDANLLTQIAEIDQESVLKRINCPILIIHGDADQQELDLLGVSKKAFAFLSKDSQLELIPGGSHTFIDHSDKVIELTKKWYKTFFPLK